MLTITDRDLLILDPTVFVDAGDVATKLLSGTDGQVSGSSLVSAASDFVAANIDDGHVAIVDGESLDVDGRVNTTTLTVSLPRKSAADAIIPPKDGSNLAFSVLTFERAINESRSWVLGALGVDPQDPLHPLDSDAILNADRIGSLIAMRTLARVYASAAALHPTDASLSERARVWAERAGQQMRQTDALIDLDGDGIADAIRRINIINLVRA